MTETIVSRRTYVLVWAALMILTVVTAAVSRVNLGDWSAAVAIFIACTKAALVALFFMHLRYEHSKIVTVWAVAGIFWLIILFFLSLTDYLTRNVLNVPGK
jgi:cytochrome c oxidase subunit 4